MGQLLRARSSLIGSIGPASPQVPIKICQTKLLSGDMSTDHGTCVCVRREGPEPGAGSGEKSLEMGPGDLELWLNNDLIRHWHSTAACHVVRNLAA